MIYKIMLLSTLISVSAQAEVRINVDSLYIVNSSSQSNIQKEYRIEIFNNTDTDCLFFISPDTSKEKNVTQKFKSFLKQDVGDGWRMIHLIYETDMI